MGPNKRALLITGGSTNFVVDVAALGSFDLVVAADSGLDSAIGLGLSPDVVVGDLDSVSRAVLDRAVADGVRVVAAPVDKDHTDTELALRHAVDAGVDAIVVLSPGGGRLDHAHGVITSLANPDLAHVAIEAVIDTAHVTVLHGPGRCEVPRRGSHLLALHAMNGTTTGISTVGLRWNLSGESLHPWTSRGVSNEMLGDSAVINVDLGALLVIQPNAYGEHP